MINGGSFEWLSRVEDGDPIWGSSKGAEPISTANHEKHNDDNLLPCLSPAVFPTNLCLIFDLALLRSITRQYFELRTIVSPLSSHWLHRVIVRRK